MSNAVTSSTSPPSLENHSGVGKILAVISTILVYLVYSSYGSWPLIVLVALVKRNAFFSWLAPCCYKFWKIFWGALWKEVKPVLPMYRDDFLPLEELDD